MPLFPKRICMRKISPIKYHPASDLGIFCCTQLYPMSRPHGPHDETLFVFAMQMTRLFLYPQAANYPLKTITTFLKNAGYLIKYQKIVSGETFETRWFLPHPIHKKFIEIDEAMVKASGEKVEDKWKESLRYLKFRCDKHQGPFYLCRIVQRKESPGCPMLKEVKRPAVQRTATWDKIFEEDWMEMEG